MPIMNRFIIALFLVPAPLLSQGADDCANADIIVLGSYPFNTAACSDTGTLATTGAISACTMTSDVWFTFDGIVNGVGEISTCGTTGIDTTLALYQGTACGGLTLVECNPGWTFCAGGSNLIAFPVQLGVRYYVQLGADDPAGTTHGQGTLEVIQNGPPPPPAAADHCVNAPTIGPGYTSHFFLSHLASDTFAAATTSAGGGCGPVNDIWLRWVAVESGAATFDTCTNPTYDTAVGVFEGTACTNFVFLGCNDDAPGCALGASSLTVPVVQGRTYYIQIGVGAASLPVHGEATLTVSAGPAGNPGTPYCLAHVNSTGVPGVISAAGSRQVSDNDVTLIATNLPAQQFGFFLNARMPHALPFPGGQPGVFCLNGAIGRYNLSVLNSGAQGTGSLALDLPVTPVPQGTVAIAPGETWYFSCWFRDQNPGMTSNFTGGVAITFE